MRLFIMPNGKELYGDFGDAVVCHHCLETDYDLNEANRMTDVECERAIEALDLAPVGSSCWSCEVGSA